MFASDQQRLPATILPVSNLVVPIGVIVAPLRTLYVEGRDDFSAGRTGSRRPNGW
jgi:hypothetical protein